MGSLGDDDGEIKLIGGSLHTDFAHSRTQPFDSQASLSSLPGEKAEDANEFQFFQSTVPFDDTLPVEDEFETQVINVGGETQLLDEMDGFGSIDDVLIDEFDNHIALDSDGDETDGTEILDDNDELSGYELERRGQCQWLREDKIQPEPNCNLGKIGLTENPNTSASSHKNSGLFPRFTSIRAESLRAFGLAAHKNSLSHPLSTCNHLLDQADKNDALRTKICDEFDHVHDIGKCHVEVNAFKKENKSKIASSTIRKLVYEDSFVEKVGPSCYDDNTVGGEEVLQSVACDDGLAGLSYIDSQEPGEASQANALECVQKLVEENKELFDYGIDQGKSSNGTSNHISMTKGPQNLAKRSVDRTANGKTKIFDWDDEIEDEGGGDIFCRRKKDFFGGKNVQNENMIRSDSKLDLCDVDDKEAKETEANIRKNLADEFNEQPNLDRSNGQSEAAITGNNNAERISVGLDTQIAVEAMEALFYGDVPNHCTDDGLQAMQVSCKESLKGHPRSKAGKGVTRGSKNKSRICDKSRKQSSISLDKPSKEVRNEDNADLVMTRRKTANARRRKIMKDGASEVFETEKVGGITEGRQADKIDRLERNTLKKGLSGRKRLAEELVTCTPVARRTRKSLVHTQLRSAENASDIGEVCEVHSVEKDIFCSVDEAPKSLLGNGQSAESVSDKSVDYGNVKPNLTALDGVSCSRRPRSRRRLSVQCSEPHKSDAKLKTSGQCILVGKPESGHNSLQSNDIVNSTDSNRTATMQYEGPSPHRIKNAGLGDTSSNSNPVNDSLLFLDQTKRAEVFKLSDRACIADKSPKQTTKCCEPVCSSPVDSVTPANDASPVCVGNGYFKQSCKKNLARSNLMNELRSLCPAQPKPFCALKDSRRRRDLADIRVLFSHHLDEDIIKQQRKIADRLKVSIASSITEATHFITDNFVRTRNMLEAIASGKPVVTHLWLENVGQANYYIDEQNYIMRDIKKEKEFGFSMPVTLARARLHPLLQGRRVLITPSAKPGKEIISSLVRAVHGQAVERVGRSALKEDIIADDLLVLSCEEDYEVCSPFLAKGAAVYNSELLLNGIVTQRLEYERHRLFADHVKQTRSSLWLKKNGRVFTPVTKVK